MSKAQPKFCKATVENCSDTDDLDTPHPNSDIAQTAPNTSDGNDRLHEGESSQEPDDFHFAFDNEEYLPEDSESDGSEFDEADIVDDTGLLTFSNVLQLAQAAGLEAEREANKSKKRQKCYTGNSERNLRRFHANQKAIAVTGKQAFISSWLKASAKNVEVPSAPAPVLSVSQYHP